MHMKTRLLRSALICCTIAVAALPAQAATDVVIAGGGTTASGSCLLLDGFSSGTAGRSRWSSGYWEKISTPAPVCSDTDPHFDPTIVCIHAEVLGEPGSPDRATVVSIGATGPSRAPYLFKIIDRPHGIDELGVLAAPPRTGPCGTSDVVTVPIVSGGFTILAS